MRHLHRPSGLRPTSLGQDQPYPESPDTGFAASNVVADQFGASVLIVNTALQQFGADLHDAVEVTNIERPLETKADLDIARSGCAKPRLLRTRNRLRDDVRQHLCEMA